MYTKPVRPDELYHFWGIPKGGKAKNHKYIARIDLGDKFRYFYSKAELAAYEAARRAGQAVDAAKENVGKAVDATKKAVSDASQNVAKKVNNAAEDAKRFADKAGKAVTDTANEAVKDVKDLADKTGKKVSDATKGVRKTVGDKAKSVGKAVDNVGKKAGDTVQSVKRAFGDDNQYVVNKKNYNKKKEELQNTQEWKDIVSSKNKEYRRKDSNGKEYYDFDQYLVDKKHPILDALSDFGNGRKISIRKQSPETLMAGVKDYIKMAEDTVQMVAGLSIGLLTAKIKNQQGSYEDEKKALKKQINNAKSLLSNDNPEVSLAIDHIAKEVKSRSSSELANDLIDVASTVAKDSVDANGKIKKPSQETINEALDQVTEIAKSKARNQADRDKIDLAAQKAKEYSTMSRDEIKEDVKNTAVAAAKKVAGETTVAELENLKSWAEVTKAKNDLEERKKKLDDPNFVEFKTVKDPNAGPYGEYYKPMTRKESLEDIKKKEEALNKAESKLGDSPASKVADYIENNPRASAGISAYAREKGISYNEARAELMKLPLSTIKKYAEKSR